MVLSGGLGNSAYVRDCLRGRYGPGNASHPNAQNLQIRVAPDPQLVVCKGNVADRVAKIKSGQSVLGWRCCRASYGTLCKVLYDPKQPDHHGRMTQKDLLDGKLYVADCIDWFIRQGEAVSSDFPIIQNFRRKCSPATPTNLEPPRVFPTDVVSSEVEPSMLPYTFNESASSLSNFQSCVADHHRYLLESLQSRVGLFISPSHKLQAKESALVELGQEVPPHRI